MKKTIIKIIKKRITNVVLSVSTATKIGVLAVILLYVGVAGTVSVVVPWGNRSDTQSHIDYVWRIHNKSLPSFQEGITYEPLVSPNITEKFHLTASHPPLFYILHASILGPILEEGNWRKAIAIGRAINIVMGVGAILALAWAGWVYGGKQKQVLAVAVPAIGGLFYRFTTLNVTYSNDVLLVLVATLAFVNMRKLIEFGLKRKYLLSAIALSVLGMYTKAPYIIILATTTLAIMLAAIIHGKSMRSDILRGVALASLTFITSIATISWFYYLNYKSSGSWFKSSPDDFSGGRSYKSLEYVIGTSNLWSILYTHSSNAPLLSTSISSFAIAGLLSLPRKAFTGLRSNKALAASALILIVATGGIFLTQIRFAVGYGSINFRYMLAALFPFSLFLAYGLLANKNMRGQIVTVCSVAMGFLTILPLAVSTTISAQVPKVGIAQNQIHAILIAASSNGVSRLITTSLLLIFIVGAVLLAYTMYNLTKSNKTKTTLSDN